jgi:hypothetical protein
MRRRVVYNVIRQRCVGLAAHGCLEDTEVLVLSVDTDRGLPLALGKANFEPLSGDGTIWLTGRSGLCTEQAPPPAVQWDAAMAVDSHSTEVTAADEHEDRAYGTTTASGSAGTVAAELARRGLVRRDNGCTSRH